jgi:signal transduction histidine kinase
MDYIIYEGKESLLTTLRDVSHLRKAEEKIKEGANVGLFFLDIMSHDIRNHLQAGLLGIELIKELDIPNSAESVIHTVEESFKECQTLIRGVESMRGLFEADPSEIHLFEMLQVQIERFCGKYPNVRIITSIEDPRTKILGTSYLHHVIWSILENAVTHHHTGDVTIWIEMKEVGTGTTISIADNGTGISDDRKVHLFDPERRFGGVGIHQARIIMAQHGGIIRVSDRIPHATEMGAKFQLWFPKKS